MDYFPIETPISSGFPIATFDYQRVLETAAVSLAVRPVLHFSSIALMLLLDGLKTMQKKYEKTASWVTLDDPTECLQNC